MEDVAAIKAAVCLRDLFEREGHHINGQGFCLCPFHEERTPSCKVDESRFHCFGCGADGDAIAYIQKRHRCDFKTAVAMLGGLEQNGPRFSPVSPKLDERANTAPQVALSDLELLTCTRAAEALITSESLLEQVAKAKNWQPETVRRIAMEPSLGWHYGKLAFIYESGMKLRWEQDGKRAFKFEFGKASTLWRAWLLTPSVVEVYVAEGESDAISLIDAGLDRDYRKALVVAVPGASIIRPEWGPLFKGRHVVLCFDQDPAGSKAFEQFAKIATPHAAKVSRLNWKRAEALSAV